MTEDHVLPPGDDLVVTTPDGARLAVSSCGPHDGPTVVLAHCWTGAREMWATVARRLVASGHRVVLYDQRGHGSSTVGGAGCTIEALGDDLGALLEQLDVHGAVVAGHSMGGMAVQSFAARHGDVARRRVRAAVLVATTSGGLGLGPARDAAARRLIGAAVVERALRARGGHRLVRGTIGRAARHGDLELTRDLFVACAPTVRAAFLGAMQRMDLRGALDGFEGAVAVVVGTRDRLTPRRHARSLAARYPRVELCELPGRGHQLPLEAPDDVVAAIRAHTARPAGSAAAGDRLPSH